MLLLSLLRLEEKYYQILFHRVWTNDFVLVADEEFGGKKLWLAAAAAIIIIIIIVVVFVVIIIIVVIVFEHFLIFFFFDLYLYLYSLTFNYEPR